MNQYTADPAGSPHAGGGEPSHQPAGQQPPAHEYRENCWCDLCANRRVLESLQAEIDAQRRQERRLREQIAQLQAENTELQAWLDRDTRRLERLERLVSLWNVQISNVLGLSISLFR